MNQHTIFIAEDDEDDQFLLRTAFSSAAKSCDLVFFANGEQLVQRLQQPNQHPTLVLLDLNMPVLDGFQTLQKIRQQDLYRTLPVIILTTSSQRDDITKAYALGANSFITKPHQYTDLVQTVQQLQDFWLGLAQTPTAKAV
jgi:CheY-like chemotaxis protein